MADISRRHFINVLSLLGLGWCTRGSNLVLAGENTPKQRSPEKTGELSLVEKEKMWLIFDRIGALWHTEGHCVLERAGFDSIINLKTQRAPSYLVEYRAALSRLEALTNLTNQTRALSQIFSGKEEPALRQFVLAEFIELHLIHGGFRAFGLHNYKGFMGGSFTMAQAPYRVWKQL